MSNLQKWGGFDLEAAKTDREEIAKSSGAEFMKLEVGRNVVRFLPPPIDAAWAKNANGRTTPFKIVHQHYIKVPGQQNAVVFACPRLLTAKTEKLPCPACDRANQLRASGNTVDRAQAGDYAAKLRTFANVVNRKSPDRGPMVLGFGKMIHEALLGILENEDIGGDFTDPTEGGFDIVIERKGSGKETEYTVHASKKLSPLGDMSWLEQQTDLSRYARVLSVDEIMHLTSAGGAEGGGRRERGASASRSVQQDMGDDAPEDVSF